MEKYTGFIDYKEKFDESRKYLSRIRYIENFAQNYSDILSAESNTEYAQTLQNVFFTKDKAFEYENEMRLLIYSNEKNNYIPLGFDYLKKIIFGARCRPETKNLIANINKCIYNNELELYEVNRLYKEVRYVK